MNAKPARLSPARAAAAGLLLGSAGLLLSACSLPIEAPRADKVRHFTLSGPTGSAAAPDPANVKPVELAGHLRNRAMAVRVTEHEVIYLDEARWAEPLDEAITNLLKARLGAVGAGYTVSVQVQRCELVRYEGNTVQLAATYVITAGSGSSQATKRGLFNAERRTWDGRDHGALVSLLGKAVNDLGDALATEIAGLRVPKK